MTPSLCNKMTVLWPKTMLGYEMFAVLRSTTGHSKMAAESVKTCAPKAMSKILSDTADGENFGTNGRNY